MWTWRRVEGAASVERVSMTRVVTSDTAVEARSVPSNTNISSRALALADRLEQGARALAKLASELTDAEWQTRLPGDGRKIGVVVHHVANMYPLEIQLAQTIAAGKAVEGLTMNDVHKINAGHATEFDAVTSETALALLRRNS